MKIKFRAKIREAGKTNYVVTVPKIYIDNGLLKEGEEYNFEVQQ